MGGKVVYSLAWFISLLIVSITTPLHEHFLKDGTGSCALFCLVIVFMLSIDCIIIFIGGIKLYLVHSENEEQHRVVLPTTDIVELRTSTGLSHTMSMFLDVTYPLLFISWAVTIFFVPPTSLDYMKTFCDIHIFIFVGVIATVFMICVLKNTSNRPNINIDSINSIYTNATIEIGMNRILRPQVERFATTILSTHKKVNNQEKNNDIECVICLEENNDNDIHWIELKSCIHSFHENCFKKYMIEKMMEKLSSAIRDRRQYNIEELTIDCPLCRQNVIC